MNFRSTFLFLGRLLLVLGIAELVPILPAIWYDEAGAVLAFAATGSLTALCGAALLRAGQLEGELYRREGVLIVVGGWVLASVFGALPYLLTGTVASPVDALFESASGFTTTGASILTDIEAAGRAVLFWRSFSQWLGGMGIIVLFVALLSELGPGARFLYKLEVPGPTAETLHARVKDTALVLWKIYLALSGVLVVLLMLAGLDLYDALTHAFSTLSTGGFSPRGASVAAFDSWWVELLIVVFMFLAGANFSLYFGLLRGEGTKLLHDPEFRLYTLITLGFSFAIAANLVWNGAYDEVGEASLDALFQVSSILTTTGFATADFEPWPETSRMGLVLLMFVGGCAGSTAGGMKIMRMVIGLRAAWREVRLIFSPSSVVPILVGGKSVPDPVVRAVIGFFVLYITAWALGASLLTLGGTDLVTAATASIATLGNIGPGLADVGPTGNFAFFSAPQKLVMVVLMWLGRLEVYSIAAVASASFWRR